MQRRCKTTGRVLRRLVGMTNDADCYIVSHGKSYVEVMSSWAKQWGAQSSDRYEKVFCWPWALVAAESQRDARFLAGRSGRTSIYKNVVEGEAHLMATVMSECGFHDRVHSAWCQFGTAGSFTLCPKWYETVRSGGFNTSRADRGLHGIQIQLLHWDWNPLWLLLSSDDGIAYLSTLPMEAIQTNAQFHHAGKQERCEEKFMSPLCRVF